MKKSLLKLNYILILVALLIIGVAHQSYASAVIWNQGVDLSESGQAVDSCIDFPSVMQIAADDWFCSDSTQSIVGFNWWGSYVGYSGQTSIMNSSLDSFEFYIYSDNSGQPGNIIASESFVLNDVTESYIGQNLGTGDSVFKNSYILDTPFNPGEGATYWFAVYPFVSSTSSYTWAWNTSDTHWGNSAMVTDFSTWTSLGGAAPVDLAFELVTDSEEVPEPGTIALLCSLATGLFGFSSIKKKLFR
jgi:hypothetical protein